MPSPFPVVRTLQRNEGEVDAAFRKRAFKGGLSSPSAMSLKALAASRTSSNVICSKFGMTLYPSFWTQRISFPSFLASPSARCSSHEVCPSKGETGVVGTIEYVESLSGIVSELYRESTETAVRRPLTPRPPPDVGKRSGYDSRSPKDCSRGGKRNSTVQPPQGVL